MPPLRETDDDETQDDAPDTTSGDRTERGEALDALGDLDEALTDALDDDDDDAEPGDEPLEEGDDAIAEGLDDEEPEEGDDDLPEAEREQPRDEQGRFVPKDAAKEGAKDGAQPTAEGEQPAASAQPTWAPLTVTADKQAVTIDEAKVLVQGDHAYIVVPKDKLDRFNLRISRGVVGEKLYRELEHGHRELAQQRAALEAEREGPQPQSDAEIEARIWLDAVKPHLGDLFDERELENLDLKVKLAQKEGRENHQKERETYLATKRQEAEAAQSAESADEEQAIAVATAVRQIIETTPDLAGLSDDDKREVFKDLMRTRRAVIWQEGDETYMDTSLILDRLKDRKQRAGATTGTPTATRSDAATATTGATDPAAARFNRGQESAAAPRTTSVKDRRGTAQTRTREATRNEHARAASTHRPTDNSQAEQLREEERHARSTRKWLNDSTSFEFEDDES